MLQDTHDWLSHLQSRIIAAVHRRLTGISGAPHEGARRAQAEATLRDSEERYRRIVETAAEGIWTIDSEARTDFVNAKMAHMLGYRVDEMLGRPLSDFMTEQARQISDANVERRKQGIAEEHDFEFLRKDGTPVWTTLATSPILDTEGTYLGALAMVTDTSLRKSAEKELLETNTRLKATLDALPDLLFEVDAENVIRGYHAPYSERLFTKPDSFVGRKVRDVLPASAADVIEAALEQAREHGHHTGATYSLMMPSGEQFFELSIARKGPNGGRESEFVAVVRDITALRQAETARMEHERKILHTQKLESLGVLAGGIAHDFNNMLTVVMGSISLALSALAPTSTAHACLLTAESATERAAALSRQMLAYSGKGSFLVKTVRLTEIVEDMVQLLQGSISKRASLRLDLSPDAPHTQVDVTQLHQIILNLVTNASDAIGERDGVISISTGAMHCSRAYLEAAQVHGEAQEGHYTYLEVADTGCGIAESELKKIFDPFFTTKFIGRGLGLSVVHGIILGHRGVLRLDSKEGVGTTFRVLFPVCRPVAASDESEIKVSATWQGRGRVLLVDDEESIRTIAKAMLEFSGFDVVTACDGRAAVETFQAQRGQIVLVLLDLTMPEMDGEQTLRELRRLQPDIAVILSSGYSEHDVQRRFEGQGLSGFLAKPYRIAELQAALRRVM